MASKRRLAEMPLTDRAPVFENKVVMLKDGWATCIDSLVWLYDKAKVTAKNCTIIRVNCPGAVILGSDNRIVNYDNIPADLYDTLVKEGLLNAV